MFKVYGFNLKIAMFAWMPMLFADLGCILGGSPAAAVPASVWCEPDRFP